MKLLGPMLVPSERRLAFPLLYRYATQAPVILLIIEAMPVGVHEETSPWDMSDVFDERMLVLAYRHYHYSITPHVLLLSRFFVSVRMFVWG